MRFKTSCFNPAVFKKDVTRFAPAWGLYTAGVLLVLTTAFLNDTAPYYIARTITELLPVMAVINFGYAMVNTQLLFGDLFSSRLCNALHAMPIRRECWYVTHLVAGIVFCLVPNALFALLAWIFLPLGAGWSVVLWWFLGTVLSYLCFFGIGVFSVMLTGNRFAAALVYGIINFLSRIIYWLVDSLYEPLLPGIRISHEPFTALSPIICMAEGNKFAEILAENHMDESGNLLERVIVDVVPGTFWGTLAAYALAGIALMGFGFVLYRRRNLECAGDFMAFSFTEPLLLAIYTLTAGVVIYKFAEINGSYAVRYLFLGAGIALGFFTGLMLLRRTSRVFRWKNIATFAIWTFVFVVTLGLTYLDPLGLTCWLPETEDVVSVHISERTEYHSYSEGELTLNDAPQILDMLQIHSGAMAQAKDREYRQHHYLRDVDVCVEYMLRDGSVRTRFYTVDADSEVGQLLKQYYSSFEYVAGFREDQIDSLRAEIVQLYTGGMWSTEEAYQEALEKADVHQLLRAIAADCAAGNMAQMSAYHATTDGEGNRDVIYVASIELEIEVPQSTGVRDYIYLPVYEDCVHTLAWMEENGFPIEIHKGK